MGHCRVEGLVILLIIEWNGACGFDARIGCASYVSGVYVYAAASPSARGAREVGS
jgi:hypothetical protein